LREVAAAVASQPPTYATRRTIGGGLIRTGRQGLPVAMAACPWSWGSGQQPHLSAR
jgi:hypothetical protein